MVKRADPTRGPSPERARGRGEHGVLRHSGSAYTGADGVALAHGHTADIIGHIVAIDETADASIDGDGDAAAFDTHRHHCTICDPAAICDPVAIDALAALAALADHDASSDTSSDT